LAAVVAYVKANAGALVAGFLARHFSPTAVAAIENVWTSIHNAVTAAIAWAKSKL